MGLTQRALHDLENQVDTLIQSHSAIVSHELRWAPKSAIYRQIEFARVMSRALGEKLYPKMEDGLSRLHVMNIEMYMLDDEYLWSCVRDTLGWAFSDLFISCPSDAMDASDQGVYFPGYSDIDAMFRQLRVTALLLERAHVEQLSQDDIDGIVERSQIIIKTTDPRYLIYRNQYFGAH